MKKRKGGLWQRMMAVLLSAVLITGMVSNAVPMTVLAQEDGEPAQGTTNPETQKSGKPADSENTIPKDSDTGKPADSESTNPEDTDKDKPDGLENLNPGQPGTGTPDDSVNTNPEEPKDPNTEDKKDDTTEKPGDVTKPETPENGAGQETPEPGTEEKEQETVSGNEMPKEPVAAPKRVMRAAAQADDIASGTDWVLDKDGKLTISSNTGMDNWKINENGWEKSRKNVISLDLASDVTKIAGSAFIGCSNLTDITLSENLTIIWDAAFMNCSRLTNITLPKNITKIDSDAFQSCTNLTSITLPKELKSLGNSVFSDCSALTEVNMSGAAPPTIGSNVFGYNSDSNDHRCGFVKNGQQGIHVPAGTAQAYIDKWTEMDSGMEWAKYITDDTTPAEKHEHDGVTFTAWTETDSLPNTDGNYYLTENVNLSRPWYVPSGGMSLCLNGKTITQTAENCATIAMDDTSGDSFKLYDCRNAGKIVGALGDCSVRVENGKTFYMYGGNISDSKGSYAAVYVREGNFHMCGGKISGNTNGIYANGSEIHMSGGEVTGNTGAYSGGLCLINGAAMTAGGNIVITGNTDENGKAKNLFISSGTFNIDPNNPLGVANIGVTTDTVPTEGNPVNITGTNSADYSPCFHNDNADYEIKNGDNNEVQLAVKAAEHIHCFSTEWSSDSEGHWHSCSGCEEKLDYAAHDYDDDSDTDCNTCGYQRTTAAHVHNLTLTPAKDATCTEDGNTAYYICSGENGCDKWFSDEAGTQEITNHSSVVIPAAGHSYDESAWDYQGADGHAHKCQKCDTHDTVQPHTPGAAATATTPQTCTECGYVIKKATGGGSKPGGGDKDDKHGDNQNGDNGEAGDTAGSDNGGAGGNPGDGSSSGENPGSSGSGAGTAAPKPDSSGTGNPRVKQEKEGNIRKEVRVEGEDTLDAVVATPISALSDIVLTEAEKRQAATGTGIRIVLDVKDASAAVSAADKQLVETTLNNSVARGYTLGQYLDINLYKVVGDSRSAITQTNGKITVTIAVPDSLKNTDPAKTRTFAVIRVHDGKTTLLTDLDNIENTITIETDRFSTYAVIYKDTPGGSSNGNQSGNGKPGVVRVSTKSDSRNPSGGKDNEPKTGDRTPVELCATLSMIAGLTYLLLYFADRKHGMTEETKKELVSRLVTWAKQGGKGRTYLALAAIFVLLVYYHSIGKKMCVEWEEVYGD